MGVSSVIALREGIIASEHRQSKETNEFLEERLTQGSREELLFRTGAIDSGLKGEMKQAREFRNEIIHNSSKRKVIEDTENIEDQVNRGHRIVDKLWEQITEQ
ncbi:hypothetical protein [Halalkalicoccus paucihalophilus]|uniref:hypothetical protein n=1 Tax=Halalkalicoccus paucihalophilus TaxID=1008153 RepID=UPI0012ED3297|nr:hypothetical protein [Halalkalicoccus paucihalophilus]